MFSFSAGPKIISRTGLLPLLVSVVGIAPSFAGPEPSPSPNEVDAKVEQPLLEAPVMRTSRGLITLEGPSGMFINPTSATLPQNAFILNYCVLFFNTDTDVVGHGILMSYGVRDWLEVGFVGNLVDVSSPSSEDTFVVGGPMVRLRLLRDRDWWPELSIGSYTKWGTSFLNSVNAFVAASKTVPIDENGPLKTITFQAGFREAWYDDVSPVSNSNRFYGGVEVQLPAHFFLVGEATQRDDRLDSRSVPWAAGIQWRWRYFGCSLAALQAGSEDRPGVYFGVGGGIGAEPVRSSAGTPPHR